MFTAELAAQGGTDIVHIHHLSGLSLGIPTIAQAAGARVVLTLHDPWLLCARGQLIDRLGDQCVGPDVSRCARCVADAVWAPVPFAHRLPPRTRPIRLRNAHVSTALAAVDLLHAPSRHLAARFSGAEVIPLPLLRAVPPAGDAGNGPLRFLFLGALIPTKGADIALDAFSRLPKGISTLTVAGPVLAYNGSTRWGQQLVARASVTHGVRFVGSVEHTEVPDLLEASDVLLFPSRWIENSPFVLREATAAGLRVISSAGPATDELAPAARRVHGAAVEGWERAMREEVAVGRGRLLPRPWPSMTDHAQAMVERYRALR